MTFIDSGVALDNTYAYRVAAVNAAQTSAYSNIAYVIVSVPLAPSNLFAVNGVNRGACDPSYSPGLTTPTMSRGSPSSEQPTQPSIPVSTRPMSALTSKSSH